MVEPPLLPLTGEKLPKGSITSPGARFDVSARNLWSPLVKAFIDVRVFNPQAKANWEKSIPQMYKSHEEEIQEKKQGYLPRVLQVEKLREHRPQQYLVHPGVWGKRLIGCSVRWQSE